MNARGSLLDQRIVNSASPVVVFTATINTEITLLLAHNAGANNAIAVEVYHDDTGSSTFGNAQQVATLEVGNTNLTRTARLEAQSPNSGITVAEGGQIAIACSDAAVSTHVYGVSARIAEPGDFEHAR